jgi:predicted peptidase
VLFCFMSLAGGCKGSEEVLDGFQPGTFRAKDGKSLRYRLYAPGSQVEGVRYPIVLFLHGLEAIGRDNHKQISGMDRAGSQLWSAAASQAAHPCFVLAPQCPIGGLWVNMLTRRPSASLRRVMELLQELERQYPLDRDRVYVTGQSIGGFGAWALVTEYPGYFAAAVPICGGGSTRRARLLANTAIWAFHGSADPVVPVFESRRMISAVRKAGGNPRYTEYPLRLHNVWDTAYAEPGLVEWVFRQRRGRQSN